MSYFLNAIVMRTPYFSFNKLNFNKIVKDYLMAILGMRMEQVIYDEYKEHMFSSKIPRAITVPSMTDPNKKYKISIGDTSRESELFADRRYGFIEIHKIEDRLSALVVGFNRKLYTEFPSLFGLTSGIANDISININTDPMVFMSDGRSKRANSFVYYHNGRPTTRFDGKDCFNDVRKQYGIDINKLLEAIYSNEDALLSVLDLQTTEHLLKDYRDLALMIEYNKKIDFKESIEEAVEQIIKSLSKEDKEKAIKSYSKYIDNMKKERDSLLATKKKIISSKNAEMLADVNKDLKKIEEIINATDDKKLKLSIQRQVEIDRRSFMEQVRYVSTLLNQRNYALTLIGKDPSCIVTYFKLVIDQKQEE